MLVRNNEIINTREETDVRSDFGKFCNTDSSSLVELTDDWVVRSGAPTPNKQPLLFRGMRRGQLLSDYFHWQHRVRTATKWLQSGETILNKWLVEKDTFLVGAMDRIERCNRRKMNKEQLMYEVVRSNSSLMTLTHFRASVSKYFCDTLQASSVLDFSAGWGDRLTGFLASPTVEHITLIDPRAGSINKCKEQHVFVNSTKTLKTIQMPAEEALEGVPSNSIDLIITSPPYFNLECYGENEFEAQGQIRNKVKDAEEYRDVFLRPVIQNCARILKPGGTMVLNLDDNKRVGVDICGPALEILNSLTDIVFMGTAGLRKGTGFGQCLHTKTLSKAEPIYIAKKKE